MRFLRYIFLLSSVLLTSCIVNDIPFPVVEVSIVGITGEGFTCRESDIDLKKKVAVIHLDETTDISKVRIERIVLNKRKAHHSIATPAVYDMRTQLNVVLSLYQDYEWTIKAVQDISREFVVEGQIGVSEIDPHTRKAVAYVPDSQNMDSINILRLKLGPDGVTEYSPDPSELKQFENFRYVEVSYYSVTEKWELYVIPTEMKAQISRVDAWTGVAWIYAQGLPETPKRFVYRKAGTENWIDAPQNQIEDNNGSFSICLGGLSPQTEYEVKAVSGEEESLPETFTTESEEFLPNMGFEDWCTQDGVVYPTQDMNQLFWATGNPGAAIAGLTVTDKVAEPRPGSEGQYAVRMESMLAGIAGIGRLAAGNIYLGRYLGTRGTNGLVSLGRPFTHRPTGVRIWVKFRSSPITHVGTTLPEGVKLVKGDPDQGSIFMALGTWTPEEYGVCEKDPGRPVLGTDQSPIVVDTRDPLSTFQPDAPAVIAYGEKIFTENIGEWTQITIRFNYRSTDQVPTHLVFACCASRYGDFFTGGIGTLMYVDDMEFVYDRID